MSIEALFSAAGVTPQTEPAPPIPPALLPTTQCLDIPIDLLDDMPQPFRLYEGDELEEMRKSIQEHGIIQRLIVRPQGERYQIVAGRNRRNGARLAGLVMIPCEARQMDDDTAQILMIETNLRQRKKLLPSERAWAYRTRLEALNRQGHKDYGTCGTQFHKSRDEVGENELSGRQVANYIRLTYLLPVLLDLVDAKKLQIKVGVALSYLSTGNQGVVHQYFFEEHHHPLNESIAEKIRSIGENRALSTDDLEQILSRQVKTAKSRKVKTIPLTKPIRQFFRPTDTQEEIVARIIRALELLEKEEVQ